MSSYRNILKLSAWDMVAKAAYFLACLYLARIMGVEHYGVWEFSISVMAYFLLIADLGMEVWATREATKGGNIPALVGKVVPLRLIGATVALGVLLAILPLLPKFPQLQTVLVVFGLTLFLQAANLKWVFMGAGAHGHCRQGACAYATGVCRGNRGDGQKPKRFDLGAARERTGRFGCSQLLWETVPLDLRIRPYQF